MNIHNASLTISAVAPKQYPAGNIPEIALAGRSNVGKSSFVNKFLNRKSLARTSSKPGKTATLNFYNIDNTMYFVDLPGYGYAEVSKAEREKWAEMINRYLTSRPQLVTTFLIIDARHKPTKDDVTMYNWIKGQYGFVCSIVTKADKVKKTQLEKNLEIIKQTFCADESDRFILYSAETGQGVAEAMALIKELINITED